VSLYDWTVVAILLMLSLMLFVYNRRQLFMR